MNNYDFCAQFALKHAAGGNILDYGCGAGHVVSLLRNSGAKAYGCDMFYGGGDYSSQVPATFWGDIIRKMENEQIPFPDNYFSLVINNQVLEHVQDLEPVLAEFARVLTPGSRLLSLFPDRGVFREGHCGVPFLHWFPKRSVLREYYAFAWRSMGFGYHKLGKSNMRWSRDFCAWLDQWTHYSKLSEIHRAFKTYFAAIEHIEDVWLDFRLQQYKPFLRLVPVSGRRYFVNKMAGLIFVAYNSKKA
jgi:SAM-dependent methyltransferase